MTFRNGSIAIAGTLSIPPGPGPFPAVILVSGSGPQNRDSELVGFRPFKLIADAFARRGIAVLRCDDRGVGGSTGSVPDSTSEDFAFDALAAVRMLRARADIDQGRIGVLGHSEGAIVAAIAASKTRDIAFIVWLAGSAIPGVEILQMQAATLVRSAGASEEAVTEILHHHRTLLAAIGEDATAETVRMLARKLARLQLTAVANREPGGPADVDTFSDRLVDQNLALLRSPWMRFFIGFDPSTVLRRVSCPVFAAFGGRDLQVPATANRERLETALREAKNHDVTVEVFPEANHLFMRAVTGQPAEYATLPQEFVPSLLDVIAGWIARR